MIRKFKVLGLAFGAILAMSVIAASSASAETVPTLTTSTGGNVHLHATQTGNKHKFVLTDHPILGGGFATTECAKATFTSTPGEPAKPGDKTFTVGIEYKECTSFGIGSTIHTEGCHYLIHADTKSGGNFIGRATLQTCTIKITAGTCEVDVEPQVLGGITAENSGTEASMDILLKANVTGIKYKVTKDGIGCPLSGTGTFEKGDYTGDTTITGTNPETGSAVGVTLH